MDDPLSLDREEMRRLGYRVVDFLLEQEGPPLRAGAPRAVVTSTVSVLRRVRERLAPEQATIAP